MYARRPARHISIVDLLCSPRRRSTVTTTATTVHIAAPAAFSANETPAMVFDPNNMLGLSMGTGPAVSAPATPATNPSPARAWTVEYDDEPLEILPLAWKRDLSVPELQSALNGLPNPSKKARRPPS